MKKKIIFLFLGAAMLTSIYLGFKSYRNNTDRLLAEFNSKLKEGRFEQLYDESSNSVHLNVTKDEFVRRMRVAVSKLKKIDENLNFQTSKQIETEIFGHEERDNSFSFRRVQRLNNANVSATILIYWHNEGIFPKFDDFHVGVPTTDWKEYGTPGVSYKTISNPENY